MNKFNFLKSLIDPETLGKSDTPIEEIDLNQEKSNLEDYKYAKRVGKTPSFQPNEEGLEIPWYAPDEIIAGAMAPGIQKGLQKGIETGIESISPLVENARISLARKIMPKYIKDYQDDIINAIANDVKKEQAIEKSRLLGELVGPGDERGADIIRFRNPSHYDELAETHTVDKLTKEGIQRGRASDMVLEELRDYARKINEKLNITPKIGYASDEAAKLFNQTWSPKTEQIIKKTFDLINKRRGFVDADGKYADIIQLYKEAERLLQKEQSNVIPINFNTLKKLK